MRTECRSIINETDSTNSHFTESQLDIWANEAYRYIQTRLGVIPIKERDYSSSATIALNSRTLTVNEAYLNIQPENKLVQLEVVDQDFLNVIDASWLSAETGVPEYLCRSGTFEARLFPPPNAANTGQTLRTFGLEFKTDMASDTDTPDLPLNMHDLFPHYMAYRAFQQLTLTDKATNELILVNGQLKAQGLITTQFSKGRTRWLWADDNYDAL